jgi:transcriptional regulator GlxA family with amidase domain
MKKSFNYCFYLLFLLMLSINSYALPNLSSSYCIRASGNGNKLPHDTSEKKLKILFYLQNNVEILDFAGPMEVFTDAGFDVKTVSLNPGPIITQDVLKVTTDYTIANAPKADIVCFFGGQIGYATLEPRLVNWIKIYENPKYYFSVCTGAFYLGKAGLLDNLTVTTFHTAIEDLQQKVPKAKVLQNVRFVDNGRVITTAGISAGIDGALHLVSKILGVEAAKDVAKVMEYDRWVPENGLVMAEH